MGHIFFIIDDSGGFDPGGHGRFGCRRSQGGLPGHPVQIGIDDDLSVIAQVDRFEFVELLTPLLHMGYIGRVALQIIV